MLSNPFSKWLYCLPVCLLQILLACSLPKMPSFIIRSSIINQHNSNYIPSIFFPRAISSLLFASTRLFQNTLISLNSLRNMSMKRWAYSTVYPELMLNIHIDIYLIFGQSPLLIHFMHIYLTLVLSFSVILYINKLFEVFPIFPWKDGALPHLPHLFFLNSN